MKTLILFILPIIVLTSCGGSDDISNATGLSLQETEGFNISTPSNWQSVSKEELVEPKSGEIVLAFKSPEQKQGYINNIIILKQENTSISAQAIIESGIQSLEKGIKGYELLSNNDIQFADNQSGKIIIYTGKYSDSTPETVFVQTAAVCGDTSYYMTISLTEKLESYDRYEYILQNFECK